MDGWLVGRLVGVPYCLPSAPLSGRSAEVVVTNINFVRWSPSGNDVSEVRRPAPEAEKAVQVYRQLTHYLCSPDTRSMTLDGSHYEQDT